ncbi:MAG TPA: hypothetical protein VI229_00400 [Burkholderiales bacterium]
MAGKYDSQASTALALLSRKGTSITLRRTSVASADPVTQSGSAGSASTYTFQGVGFPPGKSALYRAETLQKRAMLEVYLAQKGMAVTPEPGDIITFEGSEFTVFWAEVINPAGDGPVLSRAYCE